MHHGRSTPRAERGDKKERPQVAARGRLRGDTSNIEDAHTVTDLRCLFCDTIQIDNRRLKTDDCPSFLPRFKKNSGLFDTVVTSYGRGELTRRWSVEAAGKSGTKAKPTASNVG
jgi:hypothetical protein